jgi:hypothetical protein
MKFVKLYLEGGIGDCIKVLSYLFPIGYYIKEKGLSCCYVTYGKRYNDCGHSNLIKDLVSRCYLLKWVEPQVFDSLDLPELTWRTKMPPQLNEFAFDGCPNFYRLFPELQIDEQFQIISLPEKYIVIQTSSNAEEKCWGKENFELLIHRFLELFPNYFVYIYDKTRIINIINPRVIYTSGNSLSLDIHILSMAKVLVAADSWTKYVARWTDVGQVLLVSSLPTIDSNDLLKSCFPCLINDPSVKLLGVTPNNGSLIDVEKPIKIVNHVKDITFDEVFKSVVEKIS